MRMKTLNKQLEKKSVENTIVISGLNPNHYSYARALNARNSPEQGQAAPTEETKHLTGKIHEFFQSNGIDIPTSGISKVWNNLYQTSQKPKLVIGLTTQSYKINVLSQRKQLRELTPPVYVSEMLTKEAAAIFKEARALRKANRLIATWTRNDSVFIKHVLGGRETTTRVDSTAHLKNLTKNEIPASFLGSSPFQFSAQTTHKQDFHL